MPTYPEGASAGCATAVTDLPSVQGSATKQSLTYLTVEGRKEGPKNNAISLKVAATVAGRSEVLFRDQPEINAVVSAGGLNLRSKLSLRDWIDC